MFFGAKPHDFFRQRQTFDSRGAHSDATRLYWVRLFATVHSAGDVMSRFRVGQRVKLVRPRLQSNAGMTGAIVFLGEIHPGTIPPGCEYTSASLGDCVVQWDHAGWTGKAFRTVTHSKTDRLEPITDRPDTAEETRQLGADLIQRLGIDVHAAAGVEA